MTFRIVSGVPDDQHRTVGSMNRVTGGSRSRHDSVCPNHASNDPYNATPLMGGIYSVGMRRSLVEIPGGFLNRVLEIGLWPHPVDEQCERVAELRKRKDDSK